MMSDEIMEGFSAMDSLLDDFEDAMQVIANFTLTEKKRQIVYCSQVMQQIRTEQEALFLELRSVEEDKIEEYRSKLQVCDARFKDLVSQFEWKKSEIRRDNVLDETENLANIDPTTLTREQVVSHGDTLQDKTQESLNRITQLTKQTEDIGIDIGAKLDAQGQKLLQVHGEMEDIDSNLSRAKRTARAYVRNIGSDLWIRILAVFLVLLIISILVVSFI